MECLPTMRSVTGVLIALLGIAVVPGSAVAVARTPQQLARAAYLRMTPGQRIGQLFMIGIDAHGTTAPQLRILRANHAGNVYLSGRSTSGRAATVGVVATLHANTTYAAVRPYVGTDQEGGEVQVLQGPGFDTMPAALSQGQLTRAQLYADARRWGGQLRAAGLNLDLAPVADTVPAAVGTGNQPIGRYYREFGHDPLVVRHHVAAFVNGMRSAHVATAVKHFPGLGRASGNTDFSRGVTDPTGPNDAYLAPFAAGVQSGTDFVMVSSAVYPKIDRRHHACFSSTIINGLLRGKEAFRGIVVSDSFNAAAVDYLPAGARAVRFLSAGGNMVLDSSVADLHPMAAAVLAAAQHSTTFAATVESDVLRVLTAKARAGLVG